MNVKKIIGFIAGIIIAFTGGFFTGTFNSSRSIKELEDRAINLKSKLDSETKRAAAITTGLEESEHTLNKSIKTIENLEGSNRILVDSNNKLKIENKRFTEAIGNISTGIDEDKKRVSGVIRGMDYYIKQGEKED